MTRKITRRNFVKLTTLGVASAVLAGCQFPRRWVVLEPYVRPPEEQLSGVATWYASTCRQCPAGCGVIVRIMNGRALKIEGNPEHPLNRGKLCARGQAGLQLLYNPDRLPGPVQQGARGSRQFKSLTWEEALNTLYGKLQAAGGKVAVWCGSTTSGHVVDLFQRLTAAVGAPAPIVFDLYTALNGYRLLTNTNRDLLGSEALPFYDLSHADVVFSFGADFLGTWLSTVRYGVEFGDFRDQPLGERGYLAQFEPRMTIGGVKADQWLPIRPGSEGLVALAIARIIADQSFGPADRVARARALSGNVDVNAAAAASDISAEELARLARIFAAAERPLALPGSPLTGQVDAAQALSAVQALNLIAGTAGKPGGVSPSADSPLPSLARRAVSPLADVQKLVDRMRAGDVQVLLVHNANPAYDLPGQAGFLEAVGRVPFVVSFSPIVDETAVQADLILPDRTYLEAWGYEVVSPGFGLPVVSSQQPVVTSVFDARSTGDVLLTVAKGITPAAPVLHWTDEVAFLKEMITQLPAGAAGGSGADVLWARFLQHGGWWPASPPAASPSPAAPSQPVQVAASQFQGGEQDYPYFLHLYMTAFLTDGRGANLPWLQGSPDPMTTLSWQTWVEMHPATAQKLGLQDGDVVKVASPNGEIEALVYTYPAIRPDTVAIPLGQGHTDYGRYAQGNGSNPMQLVGAQADATGTGLVWSTLRVKITPTGRRTDLAMFENKIGVTQGFINQAFPGQ
jgi:anaerobic selenocysteine-containing dehydrogenase